MNILIAGGAGFIGYHLEKKLSESHNVTVIDRKIGIEINSDKLGRIFMEGEFDAVFHLAANSDISKSNPEIELHDTFNTTISLLTACANYNIRKFVFASSSAIFGESFNPFPVDYGPLKPISHYGAAKAASEAFICSYARNNNIKVFICRFPNVVGSNATHGVILDLLKRNKANPEELQVLGDGEQLKPYMHVSELVDALIFIWKNADAWINIYNIGPKGRTKVKEIAEMITSGKITYSGNTWKGDVENYDFDHSSLTRLGWSPKMTSTEACKLAINEIRKEI